LAPRREGEDSLDKALALWQQLDRDDSPWPPGGPEFAHEHPHGPPHGQSGPPPLEGDDNRGERYRQEAVERLERLVADHPQVPGYRHLLARCYREMPAVSPGGGPNSGSDNLTKAARILETLVKEQPDVADYRYDLSETYAMLGDQGPAGPEGPSQDAAQRPSALLEKALALSEQLVAEHPNIPDYASSSVNIRLRLNRSLREGEGSRAEANLRKALDVQSSLARRFPENFSYKFWTAAIQESLGGLLQEHGRLTEARSALQDCIASFQEVWRHDARAPMVGAILAKNYMNLAEVLHRLGEDQKADEAAAQAQMFERQH
jgi:tetratricopeptide (TPR) repeat protein